MVYEPHPPGSMGALLVIGINYTASHATRLWSLPSSGFVGSGEDKRIVSVWQLVWRKRRAALEKADERIDS